MKYLESLVNWNFADNLQCAKHTPLPVCMKTKNIRAPFKNYADSLNREKIWCYMYKQEKSCEIERYLSGFLVWLFYSFTLGAQLLHLCETNGKGGWLKAVFFIFRNIDLHVKRINMKIKINVNQKNQCKTCTAGNNN